MNTPAQINPGQLYRGEEWRPILNFEDLYEVSNFGRVRRARAARNGTPAGNILRPSIWKAYAVIHLYRDNEQFTTRVHRVVFEAFHGPIPAGHDINHVDGNKENNRPENLEAITHQENVAHAIRTGLQAQDGELNRQAKLTASTVSIIRALHVRGKYGYIKLGRIFGIASGTVRDILKDRAWGQSSAALPAPTETLRAIADRAWQVLRPARKKPEPGIRSEKYMRYIRTYPCVVCGSQWRIEAHHTGQHGLSVKSSDFNCIPLCPAHHRTGPEAYHRLGPVKFAERHKLDIPALIQMFNSFYETKLKGRAA